MYEKRTRLKNIINNPIVNFMVGVILIASGFEEAETTLIGDLKTSGPRSHHGVGILGAWHMLKAVLDLFEGRDRLRGYLRYRLLIVIIGSILFPLFLSEVWSILQKILNISWLSSHHGIGIFALWRIFKVFLYLYEEGEKLWITFRHAHVSLIIGLILFASCLLVVFNTPWIGIYQWATILGFWYVLGDILDLYRAGKRLIPTFRHSTCGEEDREEK